jgi:peptidoglycan/LPS O-acetylase OafA/YrhL
MTHPTPSKNSIAMLSHLRWIAALTVVTCHVTDVGRHGAISLGNGMLRRTSLGPNGYGHAAVVVFFVLSGFLVGGKLIELWGSGKLQKDWPRFLVDRFVRIFVVLLPAILLSAMVCVFLTHFPEWDSPGRSGLGLNLTGPLSDGHNPWAWVSVTVMLNEFFTPTITTDGPLWSLAFEWSYYIMGLAAVLVARKYFTFGSLVVIAYGVILFLVAAHNQPDVLFAGIPWVTGVAARAVYNKDLLRGPISQLGGVILLFAAVVLLHEYPALPDPVLGLALAFLVAHSRWKSWTFGARFGERFAAFSYSLYVVHFPILLAILSALYANKILTRPLRFHSTNEIALGVAITVFIIAAARLFAWATEDRTIAVRQVILNMIGSKRSASPLPIHKSEEARISVPK